MKKCNTCNSEKPTNEFYKNNKTKDGYFNQCKSCCRDKTRKRKQYKRIHLEKTFIYVITHPKFKGWCKIGRAKDINKRLSSYNVGCPFRSYKVELCVEVKDVRIYELFFEDNIKSNGYEWFEIHTNEAIEIISQIYEDNL